MYDWKDVITYSVNQVQRLAQRPERFPQFWHWTVSCSAPLSEDVNAEQELVYSFDRRWIELSYCVDRM